MRVWKGRQADMETEREGASAFLCTIAIISSPKQAIIIIKQNLGLSDAVVDLPHNSFLKWP